jgi:hypothetical protein
LPSLASSPILTPNMHIIYGNCGHSFPHPADTLHEAEIYIIAQSTLGRQPPLSGGPFYTDLTFWPHLGKRQISSKKVDIRGRHSLPSSPQTPKLPRLPKSPGRTAHK